MNKKWIVTISALAGFSMAASASLSISEAYLGGLDATYKRTVTGISVQAGDILAVTAATNKKGTDVPYTSTILGTSTAGVSSPVALVPTLSVANTTWMWIYTVTSAGTIDQETAATAAQTTSLYLSVLHSSVGSVVLEDSSILEMDGTTGTNNWMNSYTLSGAKDGILLEAGSSRANFVDWTQHDIVATNSALQRMIQQYEFSNLSSIDTDFTTYQNANYKDSTALGAVFTEVIPEPATLGLVCAMGGGILFIRRRLMM